MTTTALIERPSKIAGWGAFAPKAYAAGDVIAAWKWKDVRLAPRKDLVPGEDVALQVGPDTFIMPEAHSVDDRLNHSCLPNSVVAIELDGAYLKALQPIAPMAEITFDYSLTMVNEDWTLENCRCGAPSCRKTIGEYRTLPEDLRRRYEEMKLVPQYVLLAATA